MTRYLGLQDIINSVEKSLENENYIAALTLALTIPDKCGKIEYPDLRVGERYTKWYNIWCHSPDTDTSEPQLPDADGSVIYQLRCAILHDSSTELDYTKLEEKNKLDEFELEIADYYDGIYSVFASGIVNDGESRHMRIRLIDLCKIICYAAGIYYKKNKEKVDQSNNIKIVDYRHMFKP
ncbi:MAG: hypothetical protein IJ419_08205 [Agathobacter sp.]|nr:hypothetical protein [Agathobacter sp.]